MKNNDFLFELLDFLNPAELDYNEWLSVGMALKEEGACASDWDTWSKKDPARYNAGECERKWRTFSGNSSPVTGGTVYALACSHGYRPALSGTAFEWDGVIGRGNDELVIVNKNWLEKKEIKPPTDEEWDPKAELIKYLSIFDSTENVGYVTEVWEKDGKYMPTGGCFDRTAGELIEALGKCSDICDVIGDYNKNAGAWIRINPLDGKGVKNENVTEYRYALVESDHADIATQNAIIRELELPCAALVYSGGKSLHAVVKIDAAGYEQYRRRVDFLYDICAKNGLAVDRQNRNPSRLSRMPGVQRGGGRQFIVDMNIGKSCWNEWEEWIESVNDELPDPEQLAEVWNNLPELSPCLIEGVLRQGHKMLLAGPSKAGKSFALIELSIAIAEGTGWLGFRCTQGRVLYINLELDRASCLHRFKAAYDALKLYPDNIANIDIWNLRGNTIPMDKLAPKLIRRAHKKGYIAVIIDPIYKVITGDENSAEEMSYFCNQFDKICNELGTAVIYCHHHSKGGQSAKKSSDRASGSGVFSRDPDALIDMCELEIDENVTRAENARLIRAIAVKYLKKYASDRTDEISLDGLCTEEGACEACRRLLPAQVFKDMMSETRAVKKAAESRTAWRIEGTLREFPKFPPINVWFDYPLHVADSAGILADIGDDSVPLWKKGMDSRKSKEEKKQKRNDALEIAFSNLEFFGAPVTVDELAEEMKVDKRTVWNYLKENDDFVTRKGEDKKSYVTRK